jgi:integrase
LEQVNLILQRATGVCRAQYAVLSFTGIRAGELQHLRPQDVDLANNWIHIRTHAGWKPKTGRDRRVPIHPRLAEILKAQPRSEGVYVFCAPPRSKNSRQHQPINLRRLNTEFQELAKSLGFAVGRKTNGLVIHSLRHFFETQVVDSNIPQFVVDAWMGHVAYETTGRIYYDLRDAKSIEYMQRVKF